jgi:hypothetical protein
VYTVCVHVYLCILCHLFYSLDISCFLSCIRFCDIGLPLVLSETEVQYRKYSEIVNFCVCYVYSGFCYLKFLGLAVDGETMANYKS